MHLCFFLSLSLLNFLPHASHATSLNDTDCLVMRCGVSIISSTPSLHNAIHPDLDLLATSYHSFSLTFTSLRSLLTTSLHLLLHNPPPPWAWTAQPTKQNGFGDPVIRHACHVAQPLQLSPHHLPHHHLPHCLFISLSLPHFYHTTILIRSPHCCLLLTHRMVLMHWWWKELNLLMCLFSGVQHSYEYRSTDRIYAW